MLTLTLDPSLSQTGYAVMEEDTSILGFLDVVLEYGTLKFKSSQPEAFRLKKLADGLKKIIKKLKPRETAIELPFVGKNPDTALKLGGVRGVILELAESNGLNIYQYTTFEIKKAVTGNPVADKKQVNRMVETMTNIKTNNYNISDAIAVGLCHSANIRFKKAVGNN